MMLWVFTLESEFGFTNEFDCTFSILYLHINRKFNIPILNLNRGKGMWRIMTTSKSLINSLTNVNFSVLESKK